MSAYARCWKLSSLNWKSHHTLYCIKYLCGVIEKYCRIFDNIKTVISYSRMMPFWVSFEEILSLLILQQLSFSQYIIYKCKHFKFYFCLTIKIILKMVALGHKDITFHALYIHDGCHQSHRRCVYEHVFHHQMSHQMMSSKDL